MFSLFRGLAGKTRQAAVNARSKFFNRDKPFRKAGESLIEAARSGVYAGLQASKAMAYGAAAATRGGQYATAIATSADADEAKRTSGYYARCVEADAGLFGQNAVRCAGNAALCGANLLAFSTNLGKGTGDTIGDGVNAMLRGYQNYQCRPAYRQLPTDRQDVAIEQVNEDLEAGSGDDAMVLVSRI